MIIYNGQTERIEDDGVTEMGLCADEAVELFKVNGWTWYVDTHPDRDDIIRQFISLMTNAIRDARYDERGWGKVGGGRLYASASRYDHTDGITRYVIGLGIEFSL